MRTTLLLLSAAVSMCGCTTMRVVAPADLQTELGKLEPGDSVAVRAADTWHENLTVAGVSDVSIQAETPSGERVTFPKLEIAELQVRTRAPGKTAALAAGVYFLSLYALCGNPLREDGAC